MLAKQPVLFIPGIVLQGAGAYSLVVGDIQITALSDGTVPQDLHKLLIGTTDEKIDALLDVAFLTNPVEVSINAFLFKKDGHIVLVDTGSGEMFGPGHGGKLLQSLSAVGVRPEEITDILLTHAHDDHMGGLIQDDQMMFRNGIVHVSEMDFEFFMDRTNSIKASYDVSYFDQVAKALKPYVEAGRFKTFVCPNEILNGVSASCHPGHTPGSVFYTVESRGERIVFVGDLIHASSIQFPIPDVAIAYDVNPKQAVLTRRRAFSSFAQDRTLIAVPHLPFPGVGHVRTVRRGFEWVPVNYGNRLTTTLSDFDNRHSSKH